MFLVEIILEQSQPEAVAIWKNI